MLGRRSATRRATEWELGGATIRAEAVTHRGPTLGYRITDGETTARLHPRPRAGARCHALRARARVDLRLRPRPRRRPADPRLPVHRRRVPRARRLGALRALGHAHLRPPRPGTQAAALPPRSAARRRVPRRLPRDRAQRAGRARRRVTRARSRWGWRAPSLRSGPASPPCTPDRAAFERPYKAARPNFRQRDNELRGPRAYLRAVIPVKATPGGARRWARSVESDETKVRGRGAAGRVAAALFVVPGSALADATDLEKAIAGKLDPSVGVNTMWVIVAGALVMFMQAGFAFLEIGFSRARTRAPWSRRSSRTSRSRPSAGGSADSRSRSAGRSAASSATTEGSSSPTSGPTRRCRG